MQIFGRSPESSVEWLDGGKSRKEDLRYAFRSWNGMVVASKVC